MSTTPKQHEITGEEIATALMALDVDPDADRIVALRSQIDAGTLAIGDRTTAVREAVEAANREYETRKKDVRPAMHFSFRAECETDVDRFKDECTQRGLPIAVAVSPTKLGPDVLVELETRVSLESLRDAARAIPDGHVIVETLRECRLAHNSLERSVDAYAKPAARFKVGDVVCFTNDNGVKWHGKRIKEVDPHATGENRYFLEPTDTPWYSTRESFLTLEVLSRAELQAHLLQNGILARFVEQHPTYLDEIVHAMEARDRGTPVQGVVTSGAASSADIEPVSLVHVHGAHGPRGAYDAITVVIGSLVLQCDLVSDRQLGLATLLARSHGRDLLVEPQLQERASRALARLASQDGEAAPIPVTSVRLSHLVTTSRAYDAIRVVIADLHLSVEVVGDAQLRLAKKLCDSHGVGLDVSEPRLAQRLEKALNGPGKKDVRAGENPAQRIAVSARESDPSSGPDL